MESSLPCLVLAAIFLSVINLSCLGQAIESPNYTIVHSESDYEIRLYKEVLWVSALVQGTSFQKSTKDGFHRIYQYIHGANLNSSLLPMTAPVLTSITQSSKGSVYVIRLYLPTNYDVGNPPQPNPELNLQLDKWRVQCTAVRRFSGFAKDDNINKEVEALLASLKDKLTGNSIVLQDASSYAIAQYNSSQHLSGRLNEVWIDVSSFSAESCLPH